MKGCHRRVGLAVFWSRGQASVRHRTGRPPRCRTCQYSFRSSDRCLASRSVWKRIGLVGESKTSRFSIRTGSQPTAWVTHTLQHTADIQPEPKRRRAATL